MEQAPVETRPVTRIIKRVPASDGQAASQRSEIRTPKVGTPSEAAARKEQAGQQRPPRAGETPGQKPPKKPRQSLLTPETDGGLSPDAEFGIVKAAGIIPLRQPVRPERPPMRRPQPGSNEQQRPGAQRPQRPDGAAFHPRPQMGGAPGAPVPTAGLPPSEKPGGKTPATTAKKKQKRTVFTEKEKSGLQKRKIELSTTTIRGRRKRRSEASKSSANQFVLEEPVIITGALTVGELSDMVALSPAQIITQFKDTLHL